MNKLSSQQRRIAKNIIQKCLAVKNKDSVLILAGPYSLNFAEALAFEAWMQGAEPCITYGSDKLALQVYKKVKQKFLKNWPKIADSLSRVVDVRIVLDDSNPFLASKIPQQKVEIRRKAVKPITDRIDRKIIQRRMRVALVGFPTPETAKALKISFNRLNKIFWNTMDINHEKLYEFNEQLMKKLEGKKLVRITGKETDLEFLIQGRILLNDCGLVEKERRSYLNLPAGEVFVAPVENSAQGEIYFDLPCMWHFGKQVKGVWFKFKNGKLVDYQIEKGEENFEDVLKNASGAKDRIAEFGIGTNPRAKPTGGLTIVDEKILGTIHLAIGKNIAYGGKNDSTIHWDFFKDMSKGEVEVDGKLLLHNGKLLL